MSSIFYNMGKLIGPKVRQAKWIWQSVTGGKNDAIRLENEVGRDLAREIKNQLELDDDETTIRLLNEIGSNLAGYVANRLRTFSFELIKSAEPNAFALPGGFIFVTRPLVELCDWNQDELAFILGHEMAHVIREHAIKRILSNSAINIASRAVPVRGQISIWLRKVGLRFLESAYSQDIESQADGLGVRLADAAGYDPRASIQLLGRLSRSVVSESKFPLGSYFSSHPPFEERINDINRLLQKRESKGL